MTGDSSRPGAFKAYYMAIRGEPRAFEHQPRRQKICERELRIRVDCKALENILFGLRSAGARVLVVHMSHQLQALSTSQHVLLRMSGCDLFSRSLSADRVLLSKLRFYSCSISEKRSAIQNSTYMILSILQCRACAEEFLVVSRLYEYRYKIFVLLSTRADNLHSFH